MAELTMTVTVHKWYIGTAEDGFGEWAELMVWCAETDGMSCTMAVQADGGIRMQVEGRDHATVYPTEDSYVTFNTFQFEVLTPADFAEKYSTA